MAISFTIRFVSYCKWSVFATQLNSEHSVKNIHIRQEKNVWKKPLDTMIITIFQCKLAKKIKRIPADFKDLPGWKNDIPSNVSNQKNNAM